MNWLIEASVRLIRLGKQVSTKKWSFLAVSGVAFIASVLLLGKLDLLPEPLPATVSVVHGAVLSAAVTEATPQAMTELPVKIEIAKIKLSASIENPKVTTVDTLDAALLHGAVRYPTSATLDALSGNVVLFGHSSYLPVVLNKAYQTFNGIQKLVVGDMITVSSNDRVYTYRVRTVVKESALTAGIPLEVSGRVLTLSTCDSFGEKTDRFVVTADFVESHPLSASA